MENERFSIWCEWMSNSRMTLLFIFHDDLNIEPLAEQINYFWNKVINWMNRYLEFTITIGIGTLALTVDDFQTSYQVAEEVLRYKWILEKRPIIWKRDISIKSVKEVFEYQHLISLLANSFRLGDSGWRALFEQFFNEVKQGILAHDDMLGLINYLLFTLDRELSYLDIGSMQSMKETASPRSAVKSISLRRLLTFRAI